MSKDALAWIALNLIPGIGPVWANRLAEACGSAAGIFSANDKIKCLGRILPAALGQALRAYDWQAAAQAELERCRRWNCRVITLADAAYPSQLKSLPNPTPVLYVRGQAAVLSAMHLAVVGCRGASEYGLAATRGLVKQAVQAGLGIVSGLARGIDAQAHLTALQQSGVTIAVLAHGLDSLYPPEHRRLHDRIIETGAVVSEFPIGVRPLPQNFPRRNRIISALAQGVLVVEAGEKSGALITAQWALEQNREVFAVPGPFQSRTSQGTHRLIQQGAKLVMNLADILDEWPAPPRMAVKPAPTAIALPPISACQQSIRLALGDQIMAIDQLADRCLLPMPQLLAELVNLEMIGRVKSRPGQRYQWNGE